MAADLHVHTNYSDARQTPAQVIAQCIAAGIDTVAIADHDTVAGVGPTIAAAAGSGVRVVPAVEMTAYEEKTEIHILGLFIDPGPTRLTAVIRETAEARRTRVHTMVALLRKLRIPITIADVLRIAGNGVPGRLHVAQALVKCGQVPDIAGAFSNYIGYGCPAYVPKRVLSFAEAADAIHAAGGVPIAAHPGTGISDDLLNRMLAGGVLGIEVYHPLHSPAQVEHYFRFAEERGVLVSGGSDSHGEVREATQIGAVKLDEARLRLIEKRAAQIAHDRRGK